MIKTCLYCQDTVFSILAAAVIPQSRFIGFGGNLCGAGVKALGVSLRACDSGEQIPAATYGPVIVESGGVFAAGDAITSDSQGRAVKATNFAVASTPTVGVETALDIDVTPTVNVSIPAGETNVTSTGAQPALTISASATATGTAMNTVSASVANSLSGGVLPQAVNGYALDASTGSGQFVRVILR